MVQELREYFTYDIVEGPKGDVAVNLGGATYSLEQISGMVLGHAKTDRRAVPGRPLPRGGHLGARLLQRPASAAAVKEAGRLAGFEVKRIVNEPTAAALAYGFNRGLDQNVLVYDLGGGTFDVSVLQITGNVFEVLATGGDTFLGGVDFDNRIIDYVLETFQQQTRVDLSQSPIAMQRIKNAAEAAKIDLTLIPNVVIELPYIEERKGKPLDLRIPLSREQLNALTRDLVDRTFDLCDRVLAEKGIAKSSIDEIILVGGQIRMPLVQQEITRALRQASAQGRAPGRVRWRSGAALLADSLGNIDAVTLLDALSMPIGYAMPNGRFRKIIEKNSIIPLTKSFRLPPPKERAARSSSWTSSRATASSSSTTSTWAR